jgi:hypothetical protein
MRLLWSRHPTLPTTSPVLVTLPVPHFIGILPFPILNSVIIPLVSLLLIATISVVFLLIDLSPLRAHPFSLGLLVVMSATISFPIKARMIMMGHPFSLCDHCPFSLVI